MNHKPSICFVGLNAYNILSGREDISHIGGAEVQQVCIASWLARKGYPVSFVTLDHGQPDGIDLHGINTFKAYVKDSGMRGLRFLHPRWSGLWAAMTRADADIYYQRGADDQTGQVALWCYLHRRRFIFAVANDSDCIASLYALGSWREKALYRLGLRLADTVTVQTSTQQRLLRQNMGVSTVLVRNCGWNLPNGSEFELPSNNHAGASRVLWVGRFSKHKRLEWLLDIAEQCPAIMFDVIGTSATDSDYASSLVDRANGFSNVKMHGLIPHNEITKYYRQCHILCCTSAYEGFPNTYLEAWSMGIPVVSTFDPDGVVTKNGLGIVAKEMKGIVAGLKRMTDSKETWIKASRAAKQYYLENHTPEVCLPKFERDLLQVAGYGVDSK